jgi:hypothetical protein
MPIPITLRAFPNRATTAIRPTSLHFKQFGHSGDEFLAATGLA